MSTAKQWAAFAHKIERDRAFGRAIDREFFELLGDRTVGQGEPGSGHCWKLFDPQHRRWCALPRVSGDLSDAMRFWPAGWSFALLAGEGLKFFKCEACCCWQGPSNADSCRVERQAVSAHNNHDPARAVLACIARIHQFRAEHPRVVIL